MHEMSIAQTILEMVEAEMARHPGAKLLALDIQVGELSCVQDDSLRFCLEASLKDSRWPDAAIQLEAEGVGAQCNRCGQHFKPDHYQFVCPGCGSADVAVVGGQEVRLRSLEIDE